MEISLDLVEAILNSLDTRYEREKVSLAGAESVEIRLFNQVTGEQTARLEFTERKLTKVDYWDKAKKTIETVEWPT